DLRIQTSVRDLELEEEGIPLGIRGGDPAAWPDYHAALLAPEVVTAVASPAYIESHGMPGDVEALAQMRLIHLDEPVRVACDWKEWLESAGLQYRPQSRPLTIND